jgi:hypothetical protein
MKLALIAPALVALAACGGSVVAPTESGDDGGTGNPPPDSGVTHADAASAHDGGIPSDSGAPPDGSTVVDAGWSPAAHAPLPQVPDQGGPLLTAPVLVTITYPNFQYEAAVKSFGDFVVGSNWISTVGADYGVGKGTHQHVVLSTPAPASVTSGDTESTIAAKIADGTLPGGVQTKPTNYLYMIFYPPTTTIADLDPSSTCAATNDVGGTAWHMSVNEMQQSFAYAVVPTCTKTGVPLLETAASHELIEAMTDSYPLAVPAFQMPPTSSWQVIGEVGDLCEFLPSTSEAGHTLTRVWSNSAAAKNQSPCIPDALVPFVDLSVSPDVIHTVGAVTGWSTQPVPDWYVQAYPYGYQVTPTASLSGSTINDGKSLTLTVGVPANAQSGSQAWVILYSLRGGQPASVWPVAITVP